MAEIPRLKSGIVESPPFHFLGRPFCGVVMIGRPRKPGAIKVREYLATGKPVVIAPLPEYEHMGDVIRIARTREDFLQKVEEALSEDDETLVAARQRSVRDGTWRARADWVSELILQAEDVRSKKLRTMSG